MIIIGISKKIYITLINVLAVLCLTFTSFADDGTYSDAASVREMVTELYSNEKNAAVRDMALDYALVLTGFKEPEQVYNDGTTLVGIYDIYPDLNFTTDISLIGQNMPIIGFVTDNGRTVIGTAHGEPLTEEAFAKNIEDLEMIYAMVCAVRSATEGMDDVAKLKYIEEFIKTLVPNYVAGCSPVVASAINNRYCDCDGYAQLTYLLSINTGLDARNVSGTNINNGAGHAWNEVTIDNITYLQDTCWDITANTKKYFLTLNTESHNKYDTSFNNIDDAETEVTYTLNVK